MKQVAPITEPFDIVNKDYYDNHHPPVSAGVIAVPSYQDNGNGTVTIGQGTYSLYTNTSGTGVPVVVTIASATLSIVAGTTYTIAADYNSGSPQLIVTTPSAITETSIIPIYTVYRDGNTVYHISWDTLGKALPNKLNQSLVKTQRYRRESGLSLGESTGRVVSITSGTVWTGAVANSLATFSSNTTGHDMYLYYHSDGVWTRSPRITQYNNTQYDDGQNLQTTLPNQYVVNYIYRSLDSVKNEVYIVLGTASYKLTEALESQPPASLPGIISNLSMLVGRIIVVAGAATASYINSAFAQLFANSGLTYHNETSGLQGGGTNEYYHLTSAQYTIATTPASSTVSGYLSSTDWNTFNNKQAALGYAPANRAGDTFTGNVTAPKFIKSGGTASQFLKADGSVDSSSYETTITAGTTSQYYRGDKTWQALDTAAVTESTNLYFTNARVLGTVLTGLDTTLTGAVVASDTILAAIGKLENRVAGFTASYVSSFNTRTGAVTLTSGDVTGALGFSPSPDTHTHPASSITNTPAGNIAATTVQAAIDELDSEKGGLAQGNTWVGSNTFTQSLAALQFVKSGGTASQFLKADGSVDSNSYLTGITSNMVTTALGYTPYDAANPNNYISLSAVTDAVVTGKQLTGYTPVSGAITSADTILSAFNKLGYDKHSPVTLGTSNGLSLSTQQLSLALASTSTTGALSSADWNTFNNKQAALGYTPANRAGDTFTGDVTATSFTGSGAGLTGTAASLRSGTSGTSDYAYNTTTLDLSGLDQSTWYPVTFPVLTNRRIRHRITVALDSGTVPAWSTHTAGFSVICDWSTNGSGWGTIAVTRTIHAYTYRYATVSPVGGIGQMGNSSTEFVYLRGGGKYRFESDYPVTPAIQTSSYTVYSETIAPTTTLFNDVYSSATCSVGFGDVHTTGHFIGSGAGLTGTASNLSVNYANTAGNASNSAAIGGIGGWSTNAWAGAFGYPGYAFAGGNTRFGFSSTEGTCDVYCDGNFYAGDAGYPVVHAGNIGSQSVASAAQLSGGSYSNTVSWNGYRTRISSTAGWIDLGNGNGPGNTTYFELFTSCSAFYMGSPLVVSGSIQSTTATLRTAYPSLYFSPTSGATKAGVIFQNADTLYMGANGVANYAWMDLGTGNTTFTGILTVAKVETTSNGTSGGIILRNPSGTRFRLSVNASNQLQLDAI